MQNDKGGIIAPSSGALDKDLRQLFFLTVGRLVLLTALALSVAACSKTYDWKQRIRLVISTPDGEVIGEAVQSVEIVYYRKWAQINGFARDYSQKGEAVAVELGNGRYVFALLAGASLAKEILPDLGKTSRWPDAFREIEALNGTGPHDLDFFGRTAIRLVTFGDVTDPSSIQVLQKGELSELIGPGFAVARLQIEITSDPITLGKIDKILPWLESHGREHSNIKGKPSVGKTYEQLIAENYTVRHGSFTTELY
ncbi:hypothetical protein [uncultured Tateyamaria sp.]|uniref:hypothetical protein n=1 Tax=uncultured Tateyamaria sp. TaxID=455651 RepID=UPI0026348330|nr:hypothetical protein [uncultured Tateyamaria sp.]